MYAFDVHTQCMQHVMYARQMYALKLMDLDIKTHLNYFSCHGSKYNSNTKIKKH